MSIVNFSDENDLQATAGEYVLGSLSPEERKKRLQSPETKKRFNEDERHLLEEVSEPGRVFGLGHTVVVGGVGGWMGKR